jgi:endothelin-converting enzyme/putative endopeptidase
VKRRWLALLAACGCVGGNHYGFGGGIEAEAIDWSTDPCQDFYQFACGNWQHWHDDYPDTPQRLRTIDRETEVQAMYEIVAGASDAAGALPTTESGEVAINRYYASCRASSLDTNGAAIQDEIAAIDGVQNLADLARVLARLHGDGVSALFALSVEADVATAQLNVVHLRLAGWSLPDRTQYADPRFASLRAQYGEHVSALAVQFASIAPPVRPAPVLAAETALALGSPSKDEQALPESANHPFARADLPSAAPDFPWSEYLTAAQVQPFAALNLDHAAALATLESLMKGTPLADLQTYLRWRVLEAHGWAADPSTAAEEFRFHRHQLEGVPDEDPRTWECFLDTTAWLSPVLAPIYVQRRFSVDARAEATRLIETIRTAMAERIRTRPWLDDPTRQEALQKLGQVVARIGFPDTWPPTDAYALDPGTSFVGNRIAIARRLGQQDLAALGTPVDRQRFALSPLEINAAYVPELNQIVFPAAILQQPYFALGRPAAVNLGAIGMVMGHELTHGFDNFGRHFDGQGGLRDWWTPGVAAEFGRRAQCLVDEYGAFQVPSGAHVDGAFTLPENIADLGGVLLAHDAWMSLGEPEGNDSWITRSQQFFVAFAQSWCELTRDQTADLLVLADPHAPGRFRVNGTVANVPAFAAAFSCPTGAALAPANRCELW